MGYCQKKILLYIKSHIFTNNSEDQWKTTEPQMNTKRYTSQVICIPVNNKNFLPFTQEPQNIGKSPISRFEPFHLLWNKFIVLFIVVIRLLRMTQFCFFVLILNEIENYLRFSFLTGASFSSAVCLDPLVGSSYILILWYFF